MALSKTVFAADLKVQITTAMEGNTLFKPADYATLDADQKAAIDDAIEAFSSTLSESIAIATIAEIKRGVVTVTGVSAGEDTVTGTIA